MKLAVFSAVVLCLASGTARAQESDAGSKGTFDPSYLVDGGAIPFFWGALAGRLALDYGTEPGHTPRFFRSTEGGAPRAAWEVPGFAVSGLGVGAGIAMLASGDGSRMYHIKGLAESLMTGVAVTGGIKVLVARHRPDWGTDGYDTPGSRRSFPSGHSTQAFAIATYSILYLRGHVFDTRRGDSRVSLLEAATYGGIALGAVALAGERVVHNRHHLSDVVIGGALGTLSSTLFYLYQDGRYRTHERKEALKSMRLTPAVTGSSVGVSGVF